MDLVRDSDLVKSGKGEAMPGPEEGEDGGLVMLHELSLPGDITEGHRAGARCLANATASHVSYGDLSPFSGSQAP